MLAKYCKGDEIKEDEMCRTRITDGEMQTAYKTLVIKPERKTPLDKHRFRHEGNMWSLNIRRAEVDCINLA